MFPLVGSDFASTILGAYLQRVWQRESSKRLYTSLTDPRSLDFRYTVYDTTFTAGEIGFLLNMTLLNTELLLHWIRSINEVEVDGNR